MRFRFCNKTLFGRLVVLPVLFVLLLGVAGSIEAKSLYVIASHDGTYSAYNINPGGSVTWQASYPSGTWGPAGMALHDDSATLFVTYEMSGSIVIVNAVTLEGKGSVLAPGAADLAGIDVDDINDVVYAVDRLTSNLYAYDWDAVTTTLTPKPGVPISLTGCTAPRGAFGIAVDAIANILYLACSDLATSGSVQAYDMDTWTLFDSFDPAIPPVGIAVDRLRGLVYTTAPTMGCAYAPSGYTLLSKFDLLSKVETTHDMGHGGMGLAVDELTGYLYVTGGCDGDDLSVWDTSNFTMIQTTGSIGSPAGLAIGNVSYNPLNLSKEDSLGEDGCAVPGWEYNYQICYDNLANSFDITGATLIDNLPTEVAYVSSTGTYDPVAHTVVWNLGTLAAGSGEECLDVTVGLNVTVAPESLFTNLATIESNETPPTTVEESTEVCPIIPVVIDIKPNSCRNPLQRAGKGVLPVAIVGTAEFDVTQVDPASIRLEGVAILRYAFTDVHAPYEPHHGKVKGFDCHKIAPDGFIDLTVKFDKRAVIETLGAVERGDVFTLQLTGNLLPAFGGTSILGEDVVVIVK